MSRAARLPLTGAAFLALADTGIVALALPPLLRELDTTVAGVASVLGVYAVVLAVALPLAELARQRSARAVATAGVALFALASLACGLVDSLAALLVARAVQAIGGAAVLVSAYAVLGEDGARDGVWRLTALIGTLAGPAIGGALTQGLGWRSIFLVQAPAAALALPACGALARGSAERLRAGGGAEPRPRGSGGPSRTGGGAEGQPRASAGPSRMGGGAEARAPGGRAGAPALRGVAALRWVALALVSGALAAALFLTVLLLVSGWSVEPLAAAAVVSVMPLAAFAAARVGGSAFGRAAGGSLLVAAGTASLAFVPTANVSWTLLPQLLVGLGAGLALPALAGELLRERSGADAARLLSVRHAGIALALALLAPIAQHELDTTLADTRERGAALILDARLDPELKLELAPSLAEGVESEDPRGGLERTFAEHRGNADDDELPAYEALERRTDETLVVGVNDGFAAAFLSGGALALLAAAALALPGGARALGLRRPAPAGEARALGQRGPAPAGEPRALGRGRLALAAVAVAAAVLTPLLYGVLAARERPPEVVIADPCEERSLPATGGASGFLQDAALVALDHVACEAGSSREELVLALVDDDEAASYERRYGVNPRSALDVLEVAVPG